MDYQVRFNFHLVEATKPKDWPDIVHHDAYIRVDGFKMLTDEINKYAAIFIRQQGAIIMKDSDRPLQDDSNTLDLRQFLPLHMVAWVDCTTTLLTSEVPDVDDEGVYLQ